MKIPAPLEVDLALARRAAAGDRAGQRDVVERLFDRVRATMAYLCAGDRDADDLVQLSLLEILRSIHGYRGQSRLETWADRVAVRTAMRWLRKRRSRERVVSVGLPTEVRDVAEPRDVWARREVRQRLARVLQTLSTERRAVTVLRLVYEYSIAEIAEMTNAPVNTVRDRLAKARKHLRKRILRDEVLRERVRDLKR